MPLHPNHKKDLLFRPNHAAHARPSDIDNPAKTPMGGQEASEELAKACLAVTLGLGGKDSIVALLLRKK